MRRKIGLYTGTLAVIAGCWAGQVSAGQLYALSGTDGGPDTLNSYKGLIYSPLGDLGDSGPIVRFWAKGFQFAYRTDVPGATNVKIRAKGLSFEGEAGWQYATGRARIAAYAGVLWRDHFLSRPDPGTDLTNARIAFSATLDGEWRFGDKMGVMANGQYVFRFNQYWAQLKPYVRTQKGWKIGPDIALSGGKNYRQFYFGAFASDVKLKLWRLRPVYVGAKVGALWSVKTGKVTPYFGVHTGVLF